MKFDDLRTLMAERPYFRSDDLHMGRPILPFELVQLSHWIQEGKVVRLKKGFYTLSEKKSEVLAIGLGTCRSTISPILYQSRMGIKSLWNYS
jgi:hypothetical protein